MANFHSHLFLFILYLLGLGPMLVTATLWSQRFQFVSMVKLGANKTTVSVLPFTDFDGGSTYFAVGDDKGRLHVFLRTGDVALVFDAKGLPEEGSSVASMLSYWSSVRQNESMVVTGHENGAIVMHRVWDAPSRYALHVERVGGFEPLATGESLRINSLQLHNVGRRRYILAVNGNGSIVVYQEDGRIHGIVRPNRPPIVFLKQRLTFLTDMGVGSFDLRTMKLTESECGGLNGSLVDGYVFNVKDWKKAYGVTSHGNFILTRLVGDVRNLKCGVTFEKKLDIQKPLALHTIKGYLLMVNREEVSVYNVSLPHYLRFGVIRYMFAASFEEIVLSFLNHHADYNKTMSTLMKPLINSDHEKYMVISVGNGYMATYDLKLPVIKNESDMWWTSPIFFILLLLIFVV